MFGWGAKGAHIAEADLSAYVDEAVSQRLASRIEAHTATCEECSVILDELQATKTMVARLPRMTTERSFALGPEYALASPPPRPAQMRGFLSFAPALSLTVLVVLLAVDLLPGAGSSDSAGAPGVYEGAGNSSKAAAPGAASPPAQPAILSAPADAAPRPPLPLPQAPGGPATGGNSGGAPGALGTPQAATARDTTAPPPTPPTVTRTSGGDGPTPTPLAASAQALRPPPPTPGAVEGFNPATEATPLIGRPPLQTTAASAHDSGVSFLRILEVLAAAGFVITAGALIWDRKRR